MLIPGTLLKRAMKGQLDLMTPVMTLMGEIKAASIVREPQKGVLGREATAIEILRKWVTFGYGVVAQRAMSDPTYLVENQILLRQLADLTMELYAAESSLLRARKAVAAQSEQDHRVAILLTEVIVYENLRRAMEVVRQICANVAADDAAAFSANQKAMHRLTYDYGLDTMASKALIATHLIERCRYVL